ncbi:XRE family transcriptional regulator [Mammaliicoccus lentus]|nr:XRE family transcriptional regulator [Mammaliicoccus lentus]
MSYNIVKEVNKVLHENLTSLRKKKKMTQLEVSKILDVSRPAYTAYEKGTRTPDVSLQYKLADLFDVTLDELHGREKKQSINLLEDAEVLMFSDKEGWDELSEERKKEIMKEISDLTDYYIEKDKRAKGEK